MKVFLIIFLWGIFQMQVLKAQKFHMGVMAGLNISTIAGDAVGFGYKMGLHAGILGDYRVSGNINFQPEIYFSQQGALASANKNLRTKYDYIQVPLNLKLFITEVFFFQGGPQFGYLVSAKSKEGDATQNIRDQLNKYDMALGLGFGYRFDWDLQFSFRYNIGITSTSKIPGQSNLYFPNQVLQASVSYFII